MNAATTRDFAAELLAVRLTWQRSAGQEADREIAYRDSRKIERAADRADVNVDVTTIDEQARLIVAAEA